MKPSWCVLFGTCAVVGSAVWQGLNVGGLKVGGGDLTGVGCCGGGVLLVGWLRFGQSHQLNHR